MVDNGSTDNTAELAAALASEVYRIKRGSVSNARNFGVSKASHPIIAFIDADVIVTEKWAHTFSDLFAALLEDKYTLTGYQYAIRDNRSWIEEYWFGNLKDRFLAGGNMIISKPLFEDIGGFDTHLKTGEDYDLCERAIAAGANYYEEPGFEAIHLGYPRTVSHFFKREKWHGEGDFQSFDRFIKSPVAIIAVFYLFLHLIFIVCLFAGKPKLALAAMAVLLICNLLLTALRFKRCSLKACCHNYLLNYLYFCARGFSLLSA